MTQKIEKSFWKGWANKKGKLCGKNCSPQVENCGPCPANPANNQKKKYLRDARGHFAAESTCEGE